MQKRSHALLARALLRCEGGFPARRYEWAFLFGSFQPDCNPFSYLKGSLRGGKFGGHTYANNRPYLERRIKRLCGRSRLNLWDYYTLGKLTHYVADAFTWPHNPTFPAWGWAHHTYENALRERFKAYLDGRSLRRREPCPDLPEALANLHRRYLSADGGANPESSPGAGSSPGLNPDFRAGVDRDVRYIIAANELLMAGCFRPSR